MRLLRVDRSPVRLFLFGLVGLFLMLGAVDVMWGHWVATPPDTYNEEITQKGRNQRRADYVWGAFLLAGAVSTSALAQPMFFDDFEDVRGQKDRDSRLPQLGQDLLDEPACDGVDALEGFVEDEEARFVDECAREQQHLLRGPDCAAEHGLPERRGAPELRATGHAHANKLAFYF